MLLTLVLTLALLATVAAAAVIVRDQQAAADVILRDQQAAADAWQQRATELELERDEAVQRSQQLRTALDDVQALLDTTAETLTVSERDVEELEARLRALAAEQSRAEDAQLLTSEDRDRVDDLAAQAARTAEELLRCLDAVEDEDADAAEVARQCASARAAIADLQATTDLLLTP